MGERRACRRLLLAVAGGLVAAAVLAAAVALWPATERLAASEGINVGEEVPATANDLHAPRAHNSPELAVDPTDARFAALAYRLDDPEFSCGLALSGDDGQSWAAGEPLVALPEGVDHCYAPQVAFDADGTLYYLFVGLAGQGNTPQGVWLVTSDDRGRSFARPWQILDENNYQVRLAVDRAAGEAGRLHLAWLDVRAEPSTGGLPSSHNPVVAAHSDDGGRTWSESVEVSGDQRRRVVAPNIAVGGEGEVHVVYYDLKDDVRDYQGLQGPVWPDPWAVETASSADGGQTFSDPVVVDDQVTPPERVLLIFTMPPPSVAADGGAVYTAWHDARHGEWDALVARSADRGRSWDEPVVVGDDEAGASRELLPELAVAPDGRVEVAFFTRPDSDAEHRQHVGYAASTDGARSFSATQRLTSEASDARTGPQFHLPVAQGMVEHGTGLALHAGDHTALAAWPDTRFAVPGTAQQDVYTTAVDRSAGHTGLGSWSTWSTLALAGGAGVAAAALVGLAWRRHRLTTTGALLLVLLAVGCDAGEADDAPLPDARARVEIVMDEYAFDGPDHVSAGEVVVEAHNRGDEPHELVIVPLPEGIGLDELLSSPTPVGLPPTYVVPPREPGETATFRVDLEPGRYGLVCFVEDSGGAQHHQHGMFAELEVGG